MSGAVLMFGWGAPIHGREEVALTVFNEVVAAAARMADEGRIGEMEPILLDQAGTDLGGFFLFRGTPEQIAALRDAEDMRRLVARAGLVVEGVRLIAGATGEHLAERMTMWAEQVADILAPAPAPAAA